MGTGSQGHGWSGALGKSPPRVALLSSGIFCPDPSPLGTQPKEQGRAPRMLTSEFPCFSPSLSRLLTVRSFSVGRPVFHLVHFRHL